MSLANVGLLTVGVLSDWRAARVLFAGVCLCACVGMANKRRPGPPSELEALVARRVRELRQARGLTQERLAEALGVATETVRHYEAGRVAITLAMLEKIAGVLGVGPVALLDDGAGFGLEALDARARRAVVELVDLLGERPK